MHTSLLRGFTLIEMVVVIALAGTIASFAAFQNINAYTRLLAGMDTDTIIGALVQARSDAMHDVCFDRACDVPHPHGVHVTSSAATVFEGSSYENRVANSEQTFPLSGTSNISGMSEVIFAPITGKLFDSDFMTIAHASGAIWDITIAASGALRSSIEIGIEQDST